MNEAFKKGIPTEINDFLHCISSNDALIPAKFYPYFILIRSNFKNSQLK